MLFEKILFGLENYLYLFMFVCSCFGLGYAISRSWLNSKPFLLRISLAVGIGMGVIICGLLLIGAMGVFKPVLVLSVLASGFVPLFYCWQTDRSHLKSWFTHSGEISAQSAHWVFPFAIVLICIEIFLRPLSVPLAFDELLYHLPHAKAWSEHGGITINTWLRYPYFPYNFNLLYAAGLVFHNETFAHMVHALAGALVLLAMFGLAERYLDKLTGFIGVIIFAISNVNFFSTAMIDFSVCLFIFFSFICVCLWLEDKAMPALFAAVFLFGIAAGIKYQALLFAPLLCFVVLAKLRRPRILAVLLVCFFIPCGYWYIRNYILVGDPFSPMGARVFGYSDWNAGDMQVQLADIAAHKNWPDWALWPAVGAIVFWSRGKNVFCKAAIVFGVWGFLTWLVSSHYSRYLMPVAPVLSLLSALVINAVFSKLLFFISKSIVSAYLDKLKNALAIIFVGVLGIVVVKSSLQNWERIHVSQADKSAYLKTQIRSYEIGEFLANHREYRLVQFDFGSDMYYLPPDTIGDVFGPGRLRDFVNLSPSELAQKVKAMNANAIILPGNSHAIAIKKGLPLTSPFDKLKYQKNFANYFELVKATPEAELYQLRLTAAVE